MKVETVKLNIEELEQRIAPSPTGSNAATNASSNGKSHGSTPEVPAGAPSPAEPLAYNGFAKGWVRWILGAATQQRHREAVKVQIQKGGEIKWMTERNFY